MATSTLLTRPMPRPIPFKRFRLACPAKRVPRYFFDEGINLVENLSVFHFPPQILGKGGILKTDHRPFRSSAHRMASSMLLNQTIFSPRSMFSMAYVQICPLRAGLFRGVCGRPGAERRVFRRLSWAFKLPMRVTVEYIVRILSILVEPSRICLACRLAIKNPLFHGHHPR